MFERQSDSILYSLNTRVLQKTSFLFCKPIRVISLLTSLFGRGPDRVENRIVTVALPKTAVEYPLYGNIHTNLRTKHCSCIGFTE